MSDIMESLHYFLRHPDNGEIYAGYDDVRAVREIYDLEIVDREGELIFRRFRNGGEIVGLDGKRVYIHPSVWGGS